MARWLLFIGITLSLTIAVGCDGDRAEPSPRASQSVPATADNTTADLQPNDPTDAPWTTYEDPGKLFAFSAPPGLLMTEDSYEYQTAGGKLPIEMRRVHLNRADTTPVLGLQVIENPNAMPLKEWITEMRGWPATPAPTTVAGEPALRFPRCVRGDPCTLLYFSHGQYVFVLSGSVFSYPVIGITEAEFQAILESFRFSPQ